MQATWLDTGDTIGSDTLATHGVLHKEMATDEASYQPSLDELKAERGYIVQDVIALTPDTPNLEAICQKFDGEHAHSEDEVRFVLGGEGIFDIRSNDDRWMRVTVQQGDLIVVPKDRHHRFELTAERSIRCVRLFKDPAGWVPNYR